MEESHREGANQEEGLAAGVIDGTIWKRSEPGSLMSLRIDEDKMGSGSRGNNLWDFTLLLMGSVPSRSACDGRRPHLPLYLHSAAVMRKRRSILAG